MPTATLTRLRENVASGNFKVDREAGVIRDVRILGRESKNNRTYSQSALEQACKLYENVKVNIDHPDHNTPGVERSFESGFGELRRCRVAESGIFGDLHFPKSHPKADLVCEYAERFPRQFGLSHNAEDELIQKDGKWVVESIDCIHSVDIVGCPATNAGLFESAGRTGRTGRKSPRMISLQEAKRVMRRTGRDVPYLKLLFEAMHAGVISPGQKIKIPDEIEDQVEGAEILSMEDEADQLELAFAPRKLEAIKAIAIKQIAKKSTDGRQTAQDIQAVNDFFDNSIAMLTKLFPDVLGDEHQPPGDDSFALPESVGDFARRVRDQRKQRPGAVKKFADSIHKVPVITRDEARRERILESKILESENTNWKPSANAKEFASRLRKA